MKFLFQCPCCSCFCFMKPKGKTKSEGGQGGGKEGREERCHFAQVETEMEREVVQQRLNMMGFLEWVTVENDLKSCLKVSHFQLRLASLCCPTLQF
ncbi:hypothetical protein K2173_014351 [Erythroxylum novogranatense]|uniref:Uncharacterized protein n=1 Tax=Erythroxylum novogranatense TaxID=1862640 RepID=A0AAV8S5U5_9ROSI|nr:hypothetical protein K2173_014351 [Erythroxylum novogranatense]